METAEEVFQLIEGLENAERWKLLSMLFDEYYNTGNVARLENVEEILEY